MLSGLSISLFYRYYFSSLLNNIIRPSCQVSKLRDKLSLNSLLYVNICSYTVDVIKEHSQVYVTVSSNLLVWPVCIIIYHINVVCLLEAVLAA